MQPLTHEEIVEARLGAIEVLLMELISLHFPREALEARLNLLAKQRGNVVALRSTAQDAKFEAAADLYRGAEEMRGVPAPPGDGGQ